MNDKQPEALRLADEFESTKSYLGAKAAAELRRLHQSEREAWRYADELEQERKRLHEVNAELMQIFKRIRFEQCFVCECGIEDATWELIEANIAKATGEQR